MAERFVFGWKVTASELRRLVGSRSFVAADILHNQDAGDLYDTLGAGDRAAGEQVATRAIDEILTGRIVPTRAYEYARAMELILNHVGKPISERVVRHPSREMALREGGTRTVPAFEVPAFRFLLTNYLPRESLGCAVWNPVLRALGATRLAAMWGAHNVFFPWTSSDPSRDVTWPMWTLLERSHLPALAAELDAIAESRVAELSADVLLGGRLAPSQLAAARKEIGDNLGLLRRWLTEAMAPEPEARPALSKVSNDLIVVVDGDQ